MSDLAVVGKQLKVLMRETLDNGIILDRPKYQYFQDNRDEMRDRLAIGLTRLLIDTTYFDRVTKVFISNFYMSKSDVVEEIGQFGLNMCRSSVATRIRLDIERFIKDFGKNVIVDLFENVSAPVDDYIIRLESLECSGNNEKCEVDQLRKLMIPVGKFDGGEISEERFEDFVRLIEPYTEVGMRKVERVLDREVCGYVRNLLVNGAFGDKDTERLEKLKALFNSDVHSI